MVKFDHIAGFILKVRLTGKAAAAGDEPGVHAKSPEPFNFSRRNYVGKIRSMVKRQIHQVEGGVCIRLT